MNVGWVAGEPLPEGLSLGDECELRDPIDQGAVVKVQRMELQSDEITKHLESGKQVTRLALNLDDHVSFVLGEDLVVRKFKLLDGAVDELESTERDDLHAELDARFVLMAGEFKRLQATYGRDSVGGITSSRCTNEEAYLVQKLVRAAFGNNNVDTCARVCHSPTGYGLGQTFGTSAGTQTFKSVEHADVILVIGANPTDAHPVFGSRMKKRLREGAKLIVVDPRKIDLVDSPHVKADFHLALRPGTLPDPDGSSASTNYTKGAWFLQFLEERFGREAFDPFLKGYFDHFAFQSIPTTKFIEYAKANLLAKYPGKVTEAYILGTPVEALCGHVFTPSKDPKSLPICDTCKDIADIRTDGKGGEIQ